MQVTQAFTHGVTQTFNVGADSSEVMTDLKDGRHGHHPVPLRQTRTVLFPTSHPEVIHTSCAGDGLLGDDGSRGSD
ncbi:hypothetical protein [Donghicola sp. XS_ASV15]|uniref:hypothetical protein n=1 Tax=Donghicola sp. XS_ASV15 TaxID=3241295 RepID=UPI003517BC5D